MPTPVQTARNSVTTGTTCTVTLGTASTAGNTLVAVFYSGSTSISGITLGGSADHWANTSAIYNSSVGVVGIWYDPNCAAGTSIVVTQASSQALSVIVYELPGNCVLDQAATGNASAGGTTGFTAGTMSATTQAVEFWIGVVGGYNGAGTAVSMTTPPASPWVNQAILDYDTFAYLYTSYQSTTSTGTPSYTGTTNISGTANNSYGATMATFVQAATSITATGTAGLGQLGGTGSASIPVPITITGGAGPGHLGGTGTAAITIGSHGSAGLGALGGTSSGGGTPTVTVTGSASYVIPSGYYFPYPAARPLQVTVSNTPGDWMFALVTWRQAEAGAGVTVSVADDAHNVWEPMGAPSGDSSAAGVTRTAIWYAPCARAAQNVQVAPTGLVISIAAEILDVANLSKWYTLTAITPGEANAATSLSLGIGAPAAQAFMLAALGTDLNSATIGGPGAGWTSLPAVTGMNGIDHTTDIQLSSAWQTATTAKTAAWTSTASLDLSGVTTGVLVVATGPVQPNAAWPVVITEIAPGAGFSTPPSEITWTELSARSLSMTATQGRQYTLGQLQAGTGTLTIDNPDGALIPPGTGSFAGIDSGTPVRVRVIWPAATTPHYVAFSGYFQRWPFNVDGDMLRGQAQATIQDAWAYAAGTLDSMGREEYLLDSPYAFWPIDDPAGSASATNLAPGNSNPLVLTESKLGAGGATATFGNTTGDLLGDTTARITTTGSASASSGLFTQTIGSPGVSYYGYALNCTDANYPPITNGVTIEAWAGVSPPGTTYGVLASTTGSLWTNATVANGDPVILTTASGFTFPGGFSTGTIYYVVGYTSSGFQLAASYGGSAITVTVSGGCYMQVLATAWHNVIWSARGVKGLIVELDVSNTTGALFMEYQTASGTNGTVTIDSSRDYRSGGHYQIAVAFNRTTYTVYVQGGGQAVVSGSWSSPLPVSFSEFTMGGVADRGLQGSFMPGNLAFAAIYPQILPQTRIVSHFWAAGTGMVLEQASNRIERILEYASLTGRRCILQENIAYEGDQLVSGSDVGGQPAATSVNNIAASTVPGIMTVAPTGDLFYLAKYWTWNQGARWVLGDNVAGGEIPFLPSFATDYDPSRVVNDIQLTQLDTSAVTIPAGTTSSTTMQAIEAASQAQYGDQPYQQTGYLTNDATSSDTAGASLQDLANWLANVYAKPRNRIQSITVEAAANYANTSPGQAWQFWAGAAAGDMVTVNVRLATAATTPLISLTARITQTTRTMAFSQGGTSATIACVLDFTPENQALTCDDPVLGLLNGSNLIGW